MYETYLRLFDLCYFELQEAFKGLADENVWKRPSKGLLSVGEIAGHVAYWEAIRLAGEGEDLARCRIRGRLIDPRFRYYTSTRDSAPTEQQQAMTADQVIGELVRTHEEAMADFKSRNPELDSAIPAEQQIYQTTYRQMLDYQIFHIAYHTGQIYSARHFLGEQPPDN